MGIPTLFIVTVSLLQSGEEHSLGVPIAIDFRDDGAAYGWYATADELARFLRQVRINKYLSPENTQKMFERGLGWGKRNTSAGAAYRHDGQWILKGKRGIRSGIVILPGGVEAVLLINTNGPFSASDILIRGFDASVPRIATMSDKKSGEILVNIEIPFYADEVRWTVDGSVPSVKSQIFNKPIRINGSTTLKVQGFRSDSPVTFINTYSFNKK